MWRFVIVAVVITVAVQASAQDLYTCKTPGGRTIISNNPCAREDHQTTSPTVVPSPRDIAPAPAVPTPPPKDSATSSSPSASRHAVSDATCVKLGEVAHALAILRDRGQPASEYLAM